MRVDMLPGWAINSVGGYTAEAESCDNTEAHRDLEGLPC